MKKFLVLCLVVFVLSFSVATFAAEKEVFIPTFEQTATAILDQDGNEVEVTVDLTDGWSVEFARGAVYLTAGKASEDTDVAAIGLTLDEDVFTEYMAEALASDTYREFAHSFMYVDENNYSNYFYKVGTDGYFMISVSPDADGDAVSSRFSVGPSYEVNEPALETESETESEPESEAEPEPEVEDEPATDEKTVGTETVEENRTVKK